MSAIICHLQIAKAASNSTRRLMQANFPGPELEVLKVKERCIDGLPVTVRSALPEVRQGIERIAARQHDIAGVSMMLAFGLHEYLERAVRYFAFVREPVARALSALHFVYARRETHGAAPYFESLQYRPSALIDSGELLFTNDQVRILSGTDHETIDASDLELAKHNIQTHFAFVGNSASLAACWPALCELTGLQGDASPVLNKGSYSADLRIEDDEIDVLRQANLFDAQLVEWVNSAYLPRHGIHLS